MKKSLIFSGVLLALLLSSFASYAQSDLFDGLFEREQPRFFAQLSPTGQPGELQVTYHFTHSKASALEVSLWIADLGTSLQGSGQKKMVGNLNELSNRKRDTLLLKGLKDLHFYNIGVDYRAKSALPRKFSETVVREHFRYEAAAADGSGLPEGMSAKSVAPAQPQPQQQEQPSAEPCQEPRLNVQIDPAGYCGSLNRPAVIVSCSNCQGVPWDFIVEVRNGQGDWAPTRVDGRPQAALGLAPRTEPLCMLTPDEYNIRVLAWGENCQMPLVYELPTKVQVGPKREESRPATSSVRTPYRTQAPDPILLPESCKAEGRATLVGNTIKGSLRMALNTECASLNPYAELAYIHPGYRDINIGKINLYPGIDMPFELDIDEQDKKRGIHTLRVTVYLPQPNLPRPLAAETFWVRADAPAAASADRAPAIPGLEDRLSERPPSYENTDAPMQGTINARGVERQEDGLYIDEALMREEGNTINVSATDPNCNQIQNLQLVYSPTQPDRPLYLSWLSPRCCQEAGCKYTVWAGPTPDAMSLLVKGEKSGAQVSELLQNLPANCNYFEVAVQTSNGTRKAAYIPGKGPIYGIEEVLDYHDRFQPQQSDSMRWQKKGSDTPPPNGVGGALADRMGQDEAVARPVAMSADALKPSFPISKFRPCKYQRQSTISVEQQPVQLGQLVTISYDFNEPDHQFTLYHQPEGSAEWQLAPGTQDLQPSPSFELEAQDYHNGKYLILVYKASKNWGCLSAPISEPMEMNVAR